MPQSRPYWLNHTVHGDAEVCSRPVMDRFPVNTYNPVAETFLTYRGLKWSSASYMKIQDKCVANCIQNFHVQDGNNGLRISMYLSFREINPLKQKIVQIIFKNSFRTAKKTTISW
jgi:hypothetical protein